MVLLPAIMKSFRTPVSFAYCSSTPASTRILLSVNGLCFRDSSVSDEIHLFYSLMLKTEHVLQRRL